jgi:hypothetical protein
MVVAPGVTVELNDSLQVILVSLRLRLTESINIEDVSGVLLRSDLLTNLTTDEFIILVG